MNRSAYFTGIFIIFLFALSGCISGRQKTNWDNPRVLLLLKAVEESDNMRHGFSSIPSAVDSIFILQKNLLNITKIFEHDAILFIYGKSYHVIAFNKIDGKYCRTLEMETFKGPKKIWNSGDYDHYEEIILSYDTEDISGNNANTLVVTYLGDDPRLSPEVITKLSLNDVAPILKEWGY